MIILSEEKANAIRDLFYIVLGELRYEQRVKVEDPSDSFINSIIAQSKHYADKLEELLKEESV